MKNFLVIFLVLTALILSSCVKKDTIINNYYTTSTLDSSWDKVIDPYEASRSTMFISQSGKIYLICDYSNYRSNNHGKNWIKLPNDTNLSGTSYSEGRNNIIYHFNSKKEIFKSQDDGNTWEKVNKPIIDTKGKQYFTTSTFAVAKTGDMFINFHWESIGIDSVRSYDGEMYKSTNDGLNWELVKNGTDSLKQIQFFQTGSHNFILASQSIKPPRPYYNLTHNIYSTNNGDTWIIGDANLSFGFYSDSSGIIYEKSDTALMRSNDFGNTFTIVSYYRIYGDVNKFAFSKKGLIFCGTSYGLYESLNNGSSWQPLAENVGIIRDIAITTDGYVFFRNDAGVLYRSKQPIAK